MKKLTPEEVAALPKKYKGNLSPVYIATLNLTIGENLQVSPEDWGRKYPISRMLRKLQKKHSRQYTLTHLAQNQGWVISRVK